MGNRLKRFAEIGLATLLPHRLLASRRGGRALVLAFHNVIADPAEAGLDRSLHLPLDAFRRLIDALSRTHRFASASELEAPLDPTTKPVVVFTFDDAYRGAVIHALPELTTRGIPATVFVVPGRVGSAGMWWDTVTGRSGGGLTSEERNRALDEAGGDEESIGTLAAAAGWGRAAVEAASGLATRDELVAAARLPGVTFASHTWSHPNLVRVPDDRLAEELRRPIPWLAAAFGDRCLPYLAYPYGLSDGRVERAAGAAGYRLAFRVTGGWSVLGEPAYRRSRMNVPAGLSAAGMRLRGIGLFCR